MVNISAINNLSTFEFNTSSINNTQNITENIVQTANTSSDGYIGLIIMLLLYLWLTYVLTKEDGLFRLDFVKGNIYSTGIVVIIGFALIIGNLISEFRHVIWFVTLFTVWVVAGYYLKKKNL